ncbi:MAG: thioester reductase domain-containing protein [Myxococcales bacterium]|nr:thioester reductase domain-containing protein [Myxococcales bacterium]
MLLTGATGFLGRGLLELLLRTQATITCLVRGASSDEARPGCARRCDPPARRGAGLGARLRVAPGDLGAPRLGLTEETWSSLAADVDVIVHAGATVNWIMRYEQLRAANVLGTLELLRLAATGPAAAVHLVSTISAARADGDEDSALPRAAALASSGYGLSKWIAEQHARRAAVAGLPTTIYRPAMITGHSARGASNATDFISRYLVGSAQLGLHLELDAALDMTPVDFVSRAIVTLLREADPVGDVHHLVNVEQTPSYRELGAAMRRLGVAVTPASYGEFRAALLERAPLEHPAKNALLPLLPYFPADGFALAMGPWPSARTRARLDALGVRCPAIDDELLAGYLRALEIAGVRPP